MKFFGRKSQSEPETQPATPATTASEFTTRELRHVRSRSSLSTYSSQWLGEIDELEIMADHLYQSAQQLEWTKNDDIDDYVVLSSPYSDDSAVRPAYNLYESPLEVLAGKVNATALLRMSSELTTKIIEHIPPMKSQVVLDDGRTIDVVQECASIKQRSKRGAINLCLERSSLTAIIWSHNPKKLIAEAKRCEKDLVSLLWSSNEHILTADCNEKAIEKDDIIISINEVFEHDLEARPYTSKPARYIWPATVALTFVILGLIYGQLTSDVLLNMLLDGAVMQGVFLIYLPLAGFLSSFFISIIVVGVFQLVGPISQLHANSRFYSGTRSKSKLPQLPHITIQCPVYKEGLWDVIDPTIETVKEAIATYESQGGTASIFVNDDGMQLLEREDQEARQTYYAMNHIGWVARPGHGQADFVRAGAFKKASNMNFGLRTSLAVEEEFRKTTDAEIDSETERELYSAAMQKIKDESDGLIWADGDIGLGEIILVVDADTRMPSDCFLDAAKEFYDSPELAILQHPSGVLQVAHDFWENGLAHFTRNNYFGTKYVVSSGDATPFFGHNAFLRWTAIDDVSDLSDDGLRRWWSEEHVSEDFEIALKLQSSGYTTTMAGYSENKFEEGVCLTVYDEFNRWEKYAYGVSELIFQPFTKWFKRGPFTPLFKQFLKSPMDLSAKCSSIFYMGTYFGIGATWIFCTTNYLIVGWFPSIVRSYYTDSLQILIAVTVIFGLKDAIVGPFVRYRLNEVTLFRGFVDSLKYFIITTVFFQGLSMHVSKSLLTHLIGRKMSWGATKKSVEDSKLKDDIPIIWKNYRAIYILVSVLSVVCIVLGTVVPVSWRITSPKAIIPMAWMLFWHFTVPLMMHNRSFMSEIYKQRLN